MSMPSCRSLVVVFALPTALLLAGCLDAPSNSRAPTAAPPTDLSEPNRKLTIGVERLESINIVVDSELDIQRQPEETLRAVPEQIRRLSTLPVGPDVTADYNPFEVGPGPNKSYSILVVDLDATKDYKPLKMQPDPNKSYSILVVDPETN